MGSMKILLNRSMFDAACVIVLPGRTSPGERFRSAARHEAARRRRQRPRKRRVKKEGHRCELS